MNLTLDNLSDITAATVKFCNAIEILPDIVSDEDFEYLAEKEDFFTTELIGFLQSKNDYNTIKPIIDKVNEILEAFEIEYNIDEIFNNLKELEIEKELILQVILNCQNVCRNLIFLIKEKESQIKASTMIAICE